MSFTMIGRGKKSRGSLNLISLTFIGILTIPHVSLQNPIENTFFLEHLSQNEHFMATILQLGLKSPYTPISLASSLYIGIIMIFFVRGMCLGGLTMLDEGSQGIYDLD